MANQGNNQGGSSSNRGFAGMDEEKQREIASKGGSASGGNFANDPERAAGSWPQGRPSRAANPRVRANRHAVRGRHAMADLHAITSLHAMTDRHAVVDRRHVVAIANASFIW